MSMMLVDAQVHVWGADSPERPWPRAGAGGRTAEPQRATPLGVDELIAQMNAAGVSRAVLVPPSWEGERNDVALAAAGVHPRRLAVMGRVDPDAPGAEALVETWRLRPGALGFRFLLGAGAEWAEDPDHWLWRAMERLQLPAMVAARGRMELIGEIAQRRPGLRLTVDHMGARHHQKDDAAFAEFDDLIALARHGNVAVKATALPCYSSAPYPYANLHGRLRQAFDAFGPRRMFWGSDLSRLPCPYRQAVDLFVEALPWLKGDDLEQVMGKAVMAWLGWDDPPGARM